MHRLLKMTGRWFFPGFSTEHQKSTASFFRSQPPSRDADREKHHHLVMTNIAMDNPQNKWRFLAGKIHPISIRAIYTMAMSMLNNQRVL